MTQIAGTQPKKRSKIGQHRPNIGPKSFKNLTKIGSSIPSKFKETSSQKRATWTQHGPKIGPKSIQNRFWTGQNRPLDRPKPTEKGKSTSKPGSPNSDPLWVAKNVANMAPTCPPKWSQNHSKIDPKIKQILSCFQDRVWTPKSFHKRLSSRLAD